jgi:hypothetical protein
MQEGYKDLCRVIEAVDRACYHTAYYSVTLKCDYWVEDKETLETFTEQGGEEE